MPVTHISMCHRQKTSTTQEYKYDITKWHVFELLKSSSKTCCVFPNDFSLLFTDLGKLIFCTGLVFIDSAFTIYKYAAINQNKTKQSTKTENRITPNRTCTAMIFLQIITK